ncbi:MAG: DUF692 family multinuclear iron-containing protein [Acidobacteriota bacterium]
MVPWTGSTTKVGLAHSAYVCQFLRDEPKAIDFVEVPFELLRHDPTVLSVGQSTPLILHSASLSLAGTVPASEDTFGEIREWIERTGTPWLGEHLAFITAERGYFDQEHYPGEPYNIGYSVNPPFNAETVEIVAGVLARCEEYFGVPTLVENQPVYFTPPGSTMTQPEFIREICARSSAGLLLDLTHLYITARATNVEPRETLLELPLERVVEVHVAGAEPGMGVLWDDHTERAPDEVYDLLAIVLAQGDVRAVTLEYNWSMHFPVSILKEEIARTRELADCA